MTDVRDKFVEEIAGNAGVSYVDALVAWNAICDAVTEGMVRAAVLQLDRVISGEAGRDAFPLETWG